MKDGKYMGLISPLPHPWQVLPSKGHAWVVEMAWHIQGQGSCLAWSGSLYTK